MGLCDVVSSREIWLNSISELRPRNETPKYVSLLRLSDRDRRCEQGSGVPIQYINRRIKLDRTSNEISESSRLTHVRPPTPSSSVILKSKNHGRVEAPDLDLLSHPPLLPRPYVTDVAPPPRGKGHGPGREDLPHQNPRWSPGVVRSRPLALLGNLHHGIHR